MPHFRRAIVALAAISALLLMSSATAHPGHGDDGVSDSPVELEDDYQHGGDDGHLPAQNENVDVISQLEVTDVEGSIADVAFFDGYAYLNAWEPACPKAGVHVVDARDVENPEKIGFIPAHKNSYPGEGAQVINLTTPYFSGDVLLHNNEPCDDTKRFAGGASMWDVTDPSNPKPLARGFGDWNRIDPRVERPSNNASSSHSVFAWDAGKKAYAVLVDNEETADVDIIDITKPTAPKMVAEYDLNEYFPQIEDPVLGRTEAFQHDLTVKKIDGRFYMLTSYWDGGYVVMDVTNPKAATYVSDSDFKAVDPEAAESGLTVEPEGNAHQAEFSRDNDFIVAADEDFTPVQAIPKIPSENKELDATTGGDTPPVDAENPMTGDSVLVGLACDTGSVPAAPTTPSGSQIAIVERGVCDFTVKMAEVERAGGYEGVIVFNRQLEDGCSLLLNMDIEGGLPALFVNRQTGYDLFDIESTYNEEACKADAQPWDYSAKPIGTIGDYIETDVFFDGWGYVHLFTNNAGKLLELDTYAIPEAHDPAYAEGFGDLSVHEVAMSQTRNGLAYYAYYSGGFRVTRLQDDPEDADTKPDLMETGSYIDEQGSNLWGVEVFNSGGNEYVAASDRDHGLFIFEYTGPGGPNN